MDYWLEQGVTEYILSIGYHSHVIVDYFGSSYRGVPIKYAPEEQPLGTGGGLLLAAQGLQEAFLVLNGDTFFAVELDALLRFHVRRRSDWTFALFRTGDTKRYKGMEVSAEGRILDTGPGDRTECLANGGVYLLNPSVLKRVGASPGERLSLEDDILSAVIANGCALFGLECTGSFIDIGVPEDYYRAAEILPD